MGKNKKEKPEAPVVETPKEEKKPENVVVNSNIIK